jgi:hypothetical protein
MTQESGRRVGLESINDACPNRLRLGGMVMHLSEIIASCFCGYRLRLSELTGLPHEHLHLGADAHVRVFGNGRKERCPLLIKGTRAVLVAWIREPPLAKDQPLFPNARGGRLSTHGVHYWFMSTSWRPQFCTRRRRICEGAVCARSG